MLDSPSPMVTVTVAPAVAVPVIVSAPAVGISMVGEDVLFVEDSLPEPPPPLLPLDFVGSFTSFAVSVSEIVRLEE